MKPVILVVANFHSGGIASYARRLIQEGVKKDGLRFTVVCSATSADPARELGVPSEQLKIVCLRPWRAFGFWPLKEIAFAWQLSRYLSGVKDSVIVLNYSVFPGRFFKRNRVISVVHSLHRQFVEQTRLSSLLVVGLSFWHWVLEVFDSLRTNRAHTNVYVSERTQRDYGKGLREAYVPNFYPMDEAPFKLRSTQEGIVLCVGRLDPYKGLDLYERLARHYAGRYDFWFAGDGLKALKKSCPHVSFAGLLSFKEIQELYQRTLLQVSTSYVENMPSVVFEAIGNDTPIIASDVGDCSKVLKPDYLFANRDFEGLRHCFEATLKKLKDDPGLVERDFEWSKKLIRSQFSVEGNYQKLSPLLKDL